MEGFRKGKFFVTLCLAILLAGAFASSYSSDHLFAHAASSSTVGFMIPLYYDPGSAWNSLISLKEEYPNVPVVAIINPDNGPGGSSESSYASGITSLENAGITVIGYVATGYGTSSYSSASNIESQIQQYKSWYSNIQGIFFDEMSNSASEASYYQTLENYAVSLGLTFTVGNPGTTVDNGLVGILSVLCIYENPGMPTSSDLNGYTSYGNAGFAYIAYGVSSLPSSTTLNPLNAYVSWVYITDESGSNPYAGLPSYVSSEFAYLSSYNGPASTTSSISSSSTTLDSATSTATTSTSTSSRTSTQTTTSTSTVTAVSSTMLTRSTTVTSIFSTGITSTSTILLPVTTTTVATETSTALVTTTVQTTRTVTSATCLAPASAEEPGTAAPLAVIIDESTTTTIPTTLTTTRTVTTTITSTQTATTTETLTSEYGVTSTTVVPTTQTQTVTAGITSCTTTAAPATSTTRSTNSTSTSIGTTTTTSTSSTLLTTTLSTIKTTTSSSNSSNQSSTHTTTTTTLFHHYRHRLHR